MKTLFILAGLALLFWGSNEIYQKKTRFGLLAKFASPTFSPNPEWEFPQPSAEEQEQIDAILSQKFTYLARGSQAFAFVSEDGRYVLKLFKQHKWHPKNPLGYIPLAINPYHLDYLKRHQKQRALLESCKTALTYVKQKNRIYICPLKSHPSVGSLDAINR